MIFGELALEHALGAVSAHTHRLADRVIHKGAVLDAAAIAALQADGREGIVAARLEAGDVAENAAAERVAALLLGPGLTAGRAGTGRVNLHAGCAGVLRIDGAQIDAINAIDEAVTVATLPDYAAVAARDMVATIKIIPFAVAASLLDALEASARSGEALLRLHPFRPLSVGLALSELPGMKPSIIDGTIAAMRARIVGGLGGTLLPPLRCAHDTAAIADCLARLAADGANLLLVAGASATVDRRDVGPAAIVRLGGVIEHFGMPVDPGNLICTGRIGAIPALVLPGCARSPKANGIDWVLQRLFAGLPADGAAIMRMGVGGLLKEFAERPLPRARAAGVAAPVPRAQVAAIVLAAGQSSRMAPYSKLLVSDPAGRSMIARVVDNVLASQARPVLVVVGHREAEIRAALAGKPVAFVSAPDYAAGLSASLRAGLAALPADSVACLVCLGDMPLVPGRVMDRLIDAWDADEGRCVIQPSYRGGAGNPVLWDRKFFAELIALEGDSGGRQVLAQHLDELVRLDVEDESVLRDFDTLDSLETLPERLRPPALAAMRAG